MKKLNLIAHCGAQYVERGQLVKPVLPAATETFTPISHDYLADLVEDRLNQIGMRVVDSAFALAQGGANMFGMMQVGTVADADFATVIGLRNSHIKWFPASIACGSGVFVCDNMAFSGEVVVGRKHTAHILRDLPDIITEAVGRVVLIKKIQDARYEAYKSRELAQFEAEYLMIEMVRREIMAAPRMAKVVEQWDTPDHEEFARTRQSGWRLFNAATEAFKGSNIIELPQRTRRLHDLMDEVVEFKAAA